jgi:two-component sensor histidine kinase
MAELNWAEHGGPPVTREPKPGFGNKLISRVISYDLQGKAALRFEPDGLRCRLTFRRAGASEDAPAQAAHAG